MNKFNDDNETLKLHQENNLIHALRKENNSSDKITKSQLNDALNAKNVSIFIAIAILGLVTLLIIFLVIALFRRRRIKSSDNNE